MSILEKQTPVCHKHKLQKKFIKVSNEVSLICDECALTPIHDEFQQAFIALNHNSILFFKEWTKQLITIIDSTCLSIVDSSDILRMVGFSLEGQRILRACNKK